jgi:hypothetical protein
MIFDQDFYKVRRCALCYAPTFSENIFAGSFIMDLQHLSTGTRGVNSTFNFLLGYVDSKQCRRS